MVMKSLSGQARNKSRKSQESSAAKNFTCGICRQHFSTSSTCCQHMKDHSLARALSASSSSRPKSSVVMTTSPTPHYSPLGSPLPKRPQTALATAFRKSPTPLKTSLARSMSDPLSEKGQLISPFQNQDSDVLTWQPDPPPKPEKGFVCYYCQREFSDALSLTRHSRTHGAASPYSCSYCGKMFSLYSSLMTHEKSHGSEQPPTYNCRTCGSTFLHPESLKAHERRHKQAWSQGQESRPYQCVTCHESLSNEILLKIHMQRHEGFRTPRVCTLCGTTFSSDAFLRAHVKLHEAEPPMRCVICMRHFRRSRVLLRHSDVHAEERQNVCDACERRFPKVAEGTWRRMKWLGGEERQFQCLYCGVGFSRLHQLAAHETCHREVPTTSTPRARPQLCLPSVVVN